MFIKSIGEVIACVGVKNLAQKALFDTVRKQRNVEPILREKLYANTIDEFMRMSKEEYDERKAMFTKG